MAQTMALIREKKNTSDSIDEKQRAHLYLYIHYFSKLVGIDNAIIDTNFYFRKLFGRHMSSILLFLLTSLSRITYIKNKIERKTYSNHREFD